MAGAERRRRLIALWKHNRIDAAKRGPVRSHAVLDWMPDDGVSLQYWNNPTAVVALPKTVDFEIRRCHREDEPHVRATVVYAEGWEIAVEWLHVACDKGLFDG